MEKMDHIIQLKRLIKKYHPDLCDNKSLEPLYNEVTIKLTGTLQKLRTKESRAIDKSRNPGEKTVKNDDFAYYRQGIKYFQKIHPGRFYHRNFDGTYETKTKDDLISVIKDIFISFKMAEFYFTKVVTEYPASPWLFDSKRKIFSLKKLYRRYLNIDLSKKNIVDSKQFADEMGLKFKPRSPLPQ